MTAVISTTYSDTYLFFLPIVTWSWNKLGVDTICFMPKHKKEYGHVMNLIWATLKENESSETLVYYDCPKHKEATYAQCSRLYAAALDLPENEVLITGDIDMAVFNKEYFNQANHGLMSVFGADLVPANQYPICYISGPVKKWREVMGILPGKTTQECLDELLGHLDCEHFKGNYWAKDQETIFNKLEQSNLIVIKYFRAKHPHQFATRRADRDGWPETIPPDIIDAHLKRPGYEESNFKSIIELFKIIYPDDDFTWMQTYRDEYIKLL